jgi:NAD(P)-dependent dehydrogenase (short-subunit alcohol dehydrogenase family)
MPMGRIEQGDLATFDKVIATNLRGSFIVLSRAARHVSPGGRIDEARRIASNIVKLPRCKGMRSQTGA